MRVYLPVARLEIEGLITGQPLKLQAREAVTVTAEFAQTVESDEPDELDLIAALSAADLGPDSLVAVLETEAEVSDAELGEVRVSGDFALADFECLLIADVETQELSWFGVQEADSLLAALASRS